MNRHISIPILLTLLAAASTISVRYEELPINLISANSQPIEFALYNALTTTKAYLADPLPENVTANTKPLIEQFLHVTQVLQPAFPQAQINWTEVIKVEQFREIAENNIRRINESMSSILFNMRFLAESADATSQSKLVIVQNIHSDLNEIVNIFKHPQSMFRYHPMVAIPSLFGLAALVPLYSRIEAVISPSLASTSLIACKLDDVLSEYGTLAEFYRSEKLHALADITKDNESIYLDRFKLLKEARYPEFKPTDEITVCSFVEGNVSAQSTRHVFYFKDEFSSERGFYGSLLCYTQIVQFYRFRVAAAFGAARELVSGWCTPEKRAQRSESGDGWLQVVVLASRAVHRDADKRPCDTSFLSRLFGRSTPCDPYVKVLANGHEIFKTTVKRNKSFVQYVEGRISSKIHKNDAIVVEVWDENGDNSNDALIYRMNTSIEKLLSDSDEYDYPNFVIVKGFWQDETTYN